MSDVQRAAADPQRRLVLALSAVDERASCSVLLSDFGATAPVLLGIVEDPASPAVAAMGAASCLIELHPGAAARDFVRWVSLPGQRGLALLITGRLDRLPKDVAIAVADAAARGPYSSSLSERLQRSRVVAPSPAMGAF